MGEQLDDASARPLAVVVVNYGSAALIAKNLEPFAALDLPHLVVVVDNPSTPQERRRVQTLAADRGWVLVLPDHNTGFGGGVNRGVAAAREHGAADVLLLNPDARIEPNAVRTLAAASAADPSALLCPRIVRPDGRTWFEGLWLDEADGRIRRRDDEPDAGHFWLTGACLWIPAHAWDRIGGFDESYFLYWEDVDFSRRALDAGFTLRVVADAVAVHEVGATQQGGIGGKSALYYFHSIRNRGRYAASHLAAADIRRWRRADVATAWEIIMRGGRRQFVRPWHPIVPLVRGLAGSRRLTARALRERIARVYATVRTAHLERDAGRTDVTILYGERRYDFSPEAAQGLDLVQAGTPRVFGHLLSAPYGVLELNEPLMLRSAPRSIAAIAAVRLRGLVTRRRTRIVAYCIENLDPRSASTSVRERLGRRVRLVLARRVWRSLDRVVFGTPGSQRLYADVLGSTRAAVELIPALPAAAQRGGERVVPQTVVFLGAFVPRKGFPLLLEAWPGVAADTDARLVLIGKGAGEADAHAAASADSRIRVLIDPAREVIFEELAAATVLVLPSQRNGRWREQVGLPITEGLAAGCEVVTTTETGLAAWLRGHGHHVIEAPTPAPTLAAAIVSALQQARDPSVIQSDLPPADGRLEAERRLTANADSALQN